MYATGGNAEVARLVGIDTDRYKIGAFILVGALAAVAGMFVMADLASGTTSIGSGWELSVIAGVVVGGQLFRRRRHARGAPGRHPLYSP